MSDVDFDGVPNGFLFLLFLVFYAITMVNFTARFPNQRVR
jgi:hypothetical protein